MKKVLLIYYSQSGQLTQVLSSFVNGLLQNENIQTQVIRITPKEDYPFPWTVKDFFNAMPETVMLKPMELNEISWNNIEADLVVLAYQPWYLSPSRPMSSLLQNPDFLKCIQGKPILTLITCRNMWLRSQEIVKKNLLQAGAKLIGNVVISDPSSNLVSVITTLRWMIFGKKEAFWIFPAAGINAEQLKQTEFWGKITGDYLTNANLNPLHQQLKVSGAVQVNVNLIAFENRGAMAFPIWAKFISSAGSELSKSRILRVYLLAFLLPTAVFLLSPLFKILTTISKVIKRNELKEKVKYFEGITYQEGMF